MHSEEAPIESVYRLAKRITLYEGKIASNRSSRPGRGRIVATLDPEPDIELSLNLTLSSIKGDEISKGGWERFQLVGPDTEFPAFVNRVGDWGAKIKGRSARILRIHARGTSSVLFHVINLPEFMKLGGLRRGTHRWSGRWEIPLRGWVLTLDLTEPAAPFRRESSKVPYAVTYVAKLERTKQATFTVKTAIKQLDAIQWFLSFVRGAHVAPWLATGLDTHGAVTFEEWSPRIVDPRFGLRSWASTFEPAAIQELAPKFMRKWNQRRAGTVLRYGVSHYLASNDRGPIEGRVMVAQSGIELLSWWLHVKDPATASMSERKWKALDAHDALRKLLRMARIPTSIPKELRKVRRYAKRFGWSDGPVAFTRVRNWVTHPRERHGRLTPPPEVWGELWQLGEWYLELLLLWWLDYRGVYLNRFRARFASQVEPVPWV